jgi:hypothetical protein
MVTEQMVMFNHVEMAGTCEACGATWFATGTKQGGMNDSEPIVCPKCGGHTGAKMHCAFGPSVSRRRE